MNITEITNSKFAPLINKQLFKVVDSDIHSMYETITLAGANTGFTIHKDSLENYTYIVFFIKKNGEIPSILNEGKRVNINFYLEVILDCNVLIDELRTLASREQDLIALVFEIVSANLDKFTKPDIKEFELALEKQKAFMIKSKAEFEQSIKDELNKAGRS